MEIINLKPPRPWRKPRRTEAWEFPITGVLRAPKIRQRRLGRLETLTLQQLGDLLWHAYRVRRRAQVAGGRVWESRPCPSGGGCYPVRVVVLRMASMPQALLVYFAEHHAFGVHDLHTKALLRKALAPIARCLRPGKGTLLWFVADLGLSGGRYQHPESLAWRDSGALLATIGLIAEGMRLNCCGFGAHDMPTLRRFLRLGKSVVGVGGCVLSPGVRARR
jgi:SagB-type dehydrogenase family enzyme